MDIENWQSLRAIDEIGPRGHDAVDRNPNLELCIQSGKHHVRVDVSQMAPTADLTPSPIALGTANPLLLLLIFPLLLMLNTSMLLLLPIRRIDIVTAPE